MSRVSGLILDLSFAGFVAIVDEADRPLHEEWRPPGTRYDDAGDWIEKCLTQSGGCFQDLSWIAVGVGPGSFTGIRIAMAFAQGLAAPRNLPLHAFTSFAPLLLSCECEKGENPLAVIPANSGRFYVAKNLDHPGAMVETEEMLHLADPETLLVLSGNVPATDSILPKFGRVHVVEDRWNIPKLLQQARTPDRDPFKPYYLQLSAAEEKFSAQKRNFLLRKFSISDVMRVTELERLCNPMPWSGGDLSLYAVDSDTASLQRTGWVTVLEDTGEVTGYVCAAQFEGEAEILVLGVASEHRRQGTGRALLKRLGVFLKPMGCRSVFLEVRRGNKAAQALYLAAGFQESGVRKGYYSDTGEDAQVMRWDLSG